MRRCVSEATRPRNDRPETNAGAGVMSPRQPEARGGIKVKLSSSKLSRLYLSLHYQLPIEARLLLFSMSIVCVAGLAAFELRFF